MNKNLLVAVSLLAMMAPLSSAIAGEKDKLQILTTDSSGIISDCKISIKEINEMKNATDESLCVELAITNGKELTPATLSQLATAVVQGTAQLQVAYDDKDASDLLETVVAWLAMLGPEANGWTAALGATDPQNATLTFTNEDGTAFSITVKLDTKLD